jgi:hypothetical protein
VLLERVAVIGRNTGAFLEVIGVLLVIAEEGDQGLEECQISDVRCRATYELLVDEDSLQSLRFFLPLSENLGLVNFFACADVSECSGMKFQRSFTISTQLRICRVPRIEAVLTRKIP